MGSCTKCCCQDSSLKEFTIYLIVIIFLNFVTSLIPLFAETGKTDRYKEALQYLIDVENNNITTYVPLSCFLEYAETKDECEINGNEVLKQAETIDYKNLYKNWKKIEKAKNYIRFILTALYFIFMIIIKCKFKIESPSRSQGPEETEETKAISRLKCIFKISTILSCFLLLASIIILYLNIFIMSANKDIGLYPNEHDDFYHYFLINFIMEIAIICLSIVQICFSIIIHKGLDTENNNNYNNNNYNHVNSIITNNGNNNYNNNQAYQVNQVNQDNQVYIYNNQMQYQQNIPFSPVNSA